MNATDATDQTPDHWVGFDLGGTKMLAAVLDERLEPVSRRRRKTRAERGVTAGLERIVETIRQAMDEAEVDPENLRGIGVGCPGPLDFERGMILEAPNLGWEGVSIKQALEEAFSPPGRRLPVVILNDVDAGVYGEYHLGAARGSRCAFGVFPGTGVGGGCVYEGHILQGANFSCMEIGHIRVVPEGPRCGCGEIGCLEAVASRLAVSAAAAQAAYRGQAPHLAKEEGTNLSKIRSSALAESIEAGDETIERIVRDAARHLGFATATMVHLLAPDCIVLGGGLVEALPELFVEEVRTTARAHVLPSFVDSFRVVAAELGDDATAIGAAAWAAKSGCRMQDCP